MDYYSFLQDNWQSANDSVLQYIEYMNRLPKYWKEELEHELYLLTLVHYEF